MLEARSALWLSLALTAIALALPATARAQELDPPNFKPDRVRQPMIGTGFAVSWDGRVFFLNDWDGDWAVYLLRPERIQTNPYPWFFAGALPTPTIALKKI